MAAVAVQKLRGRRA